MDFRIAVKSFIVKGNKFLMIKRRPDDVHRPGEWDIPGGRLDIGEDPFAGVKRETKEETSLDIEPVLPLEIKHFTRDDGQRITMIIFLCRALNNEVNLSEEHTEYRWIDVNGKHDFVPDFFMPVIENFKKVNVSL